MMTAEQPTSVNTDENASQLASTGATTGPPRLVRAKELVQPTVAPMRIKSIQFGIMSPDEIAGAAQIRVSNPEMYEPTDRSQVRGGVLDPRLGAINKVVTCETCNEKMEDCIGHFAYIQLRLPVFHAGYFKFTLKVLQTICKYCSKVLMPPTERIHYLHKIRTQGAKGSAHILREIWEKSKKVHICPYCNKRNGTVKKVSGMRLAHYPNDNKPPSKKKDDDDDDDDPDEEDEAVSLVDPAYVMAISSTPELRKHVPKAADELNPQRTLELFQKVPPEDVQLLMMDPQTGRPERMLVQSIPVPPLCIRPTVCSDPSQGSTEDDLTAKATEIIRYNAILDQLLAHGSSQSSNLFDTWDNLQFDVARYINAEAPGIPAIQGQTKPIRGVSQRLKGKTGRFRGNLSGKRVDFSGRTVISPDPNLRIDQVGVPIYVAKVLTYPERVTKFNIEQLRRAILNGTDTHPGANFIELKDGTRRFLKYGDRKRFAEDLVYGNVVERHLIDGDVVLFNRQPSLHRISIMCHRVKISPHRTFRFNECVCAPYNADFDGDEMNLHVPQTHEARAEAIEVMGVVNNIATPKSGEPLVAATQDFITASYLVTSKNIFMDRAEFTRVVCMITNAELSVELPNPAILKPIELWTGKQLITVLIQSAAISAGASRKPAAMHNLRFRDAGRLQPSLAYVTTETKERACQMRDGDPLNSPVMCPKDAYVCIRGGELLCGQIGKKSLGDGSKKSVLYVLGRECGNEAAAYAMNRLARFAARWHSENGFSIGVDDVTPSQALQSRKADLVADGYATCDQYIEKLRLGKLELRPGCTAEESLEAILTSELSKIRESAGHACIAEIDVHTNAALTMALCGSKGSNINISQMVACVGQQSVGGGRAPDGFFGRALPHFELGLKARTPVAKGFVSNSFFSGMTATEFFMHAQSGREGLTDTAVKTAETGYMQRRLVKALEDFSVNYDSTVRSSSGDIVQVCYGDDGLDPIEMEGSDGEPVNFDRLMAGVTRTMQHSNDPILSGEDLKRCCRELLEELKEELADANLLPDKEECNRGGLEFAISASEKYLMETLHEQETVARKYRLSRAHLKEFLSQVQAKVRRATVEPGTAVGAISAQSIGEPGTQMTLKTFHFAGVASMNITQGVPRLKEIINASKEIATPCISAQLVHNDNETIARVVRGRVEGTTLGEIALYMKEVYRNNEAYIAVGLDLRALTKLQLEVDLKEIATRITQHSYSRMKVTPSDVVIIEPDKLRIRPYRKPGTKRARETRFRGREAQKKAMEALPFFMLQGLKQQLAKVCVCGISTVRRAVISEKEKDRGHYELLVESDDVMKVMTVPGIDGVQLRCNHIMAVQKALGIEAARYVSSHLLLLFRSTKHFQRDLTFDILLFLLYNIGKLFLMKSRRLCLLMDFLWPCII